MPREDIHVKSPKNIEHTFHQYRAFLFSIAYRMLGSATDAEDMVQEDFVRWLQADAEEVQSAKAYLSTVIVRLCIDHPCLARVQRETYVGPWLPEPVLTGQNSEMTETAILAESLSFAFLILLENLGPLERAVFCCGRCSTTGMTKLLQWWGKARRTADRFCIVLTAIAVSVIHGSMDIVNLFVGAKPIAESERGEKLESKNYWGEW